MIPPLIIPLLFVFLLQGGVLMHTDLRAFGSMGLIVLCSLIFFVVLHIILSTKLFTLAKKERLDKKWLAFIPFAQFMVIGQIINDKYKLSNTILLFSGAYLSTLALFTLHPILLVGFIIIYNELKYFYEKCGVAHAKNKAIFSIIFPAAIPFLIPTTIEKRETIETPDSSKKVDEPRKIDADKKSIIFSGVCLFYFLVSINSIHIVLTSIFGAVNMSIIVFLLLEILKLISIIGIFKLKRWAVISYSIIVVIFFLIPEYSLGFAQTSNHILNNLFFLPLVLLGFINFRKMKWF